MATSAYQTLPLKLYITRGKDTPTYSWMQSLVLLLYVATDSLHRLVGVGIQQWICARHTTEGERERERERRRERERERERESEKERERERSGLISARWSICFIQFFSAECSAQTGKRRLRNCPRYNGSHTWTSQLTHALCYRTWIIVLIPPRKWLIFLYLSFPWLQLQIMKRNWGSI